MCTQSIAEAEYVAACVAAKKVEWLWKLLASLFGKPLQPIVIMCDNQSYVKLSINN